MATTKIITQEELRTGIGIGASEVAAIVHLSPYQSAYELFQIKTGRRKKPGTTDAMELGNKLEPIAFEEYTMLRGLPAMDRQVAAVHAQFPFLRAVADGWDGKRGVEIKCPTSKSLINAARRKVIPVHYAIQVLAEMEIFQAPQWDLFVYDPDGSELLTITLGDNAEFAGMGSLHEYWLARSVPAIQGFWDSICADQWTVEGVGEVDKEPWKSAIQRRIDATEAIEFYETEKMEADAELKHMVGQSKSVSAGGYKASWLRYKPTWDIKIGVESAEVQAELMTALESVRGMKGVVSVNSNHQPDRLVFKVEEKA